MSECVQTAKPDARESLRQSRMRLVGAVQGVDQSASTLASSTQMRWLSLAMRHRWWIAGGATLILALTLRPWGRRSGWIGPVVGAILQWPTARALLEHVFPTSSRDKTSRAIDSASNSAADGAGNPSLV